MEAIHRRKEANRKQRKLKSMDTEGKTTEWKQKWKEYLTTKRMAQQLIHSKITKWEKERAQFINKLPRGERERESWKKLKENLTTPSTTNIKLKKKNGETENEEEIKVIIQNFWKDIIQNEQKEDVEIKTIYSEKYNMIEEVITKEDVHIAIKKMKDRKAAGCDDIASRRIYKARRREYENCHT